MKDIRTHFEKRRGWWVEERATVPCAVPADGGVVAFQREDIEKFMDETYPHAGTGIRKVWYFNETRDREIADCDANDRVICNPQVLWRHYMRSE